MELVSNFPERLKEAMGSMPVTELASILEISKQSVSAYINGKRKPKRIVVSEIARVLHVDPAWLLGYDVDKIPIASNQPPVVQLNETEERLLSDFRKLNSDGKQYILQTMAMAIATYSGKNNAVSDVEAAL